MTAVIATLLDAGWKPITPCKWLIRKALVYANFVAEEGVSHHEVLHKLQQDIQDDLWEHASQANCGTGLELGRPHFGPVSKAHAAFIRSEQFEEAKALECLVCNKSWNGARLFHSDIIDYPQAMCTRCDSGALETPFHRYCSCKANDLIESDHVRKTQDLCRKAANQPEWACLWFRGILPGIAIGEPVGWQQASDCIEYEKGEFNEILHRTGEAGTDGGGGSDREPTTMIACSGTAVVDPDTSEIAFSYSKVPGRQSVPRAELWGLLHVLRRMQTGRSYTVYIDAAYVIRGLGDRSSLYAAGTNGDLWVLVFAELSRLEAVANGGLNFVKVKSHVKSDDEWRKYDMTQRGLILNELADRAVEAGSERFARSMDAIRADADNFHMAQRVAKRIATIEASIWRLNDSSVKYPGKDFKKLQVSQAERIKRKLSVAIQTTSGGEGHSKYVQNGWTRCRDCTARAKVGNQSYWINKTCTKLVKRIRLNPPTGWNEIIHGYREYLLHHPIEMHNIASDGESEPGVGEQPVVQHVCTLCGVDEGEGYVFHM